MNITRRFNTFLFMVLFGTLVPFTFAQEQLELEPPANAEDLPEDELATCVFDIDMTRLRNSQLVQTMGLDAFAKVLDLENAFPPEISMKNIDRVNGAFEFSEAWEDINNPGGEPFKLDFYIQLHFNTDESAASFKEEMKNGSVEYEENGKKYYGPLENGFTPTNFRIHFENNVMEVGTTKYIYHPNRDLLTEKLNDAWNEIPKDKFLRAAIDVDASRELVKGFSNLIKEEFSFAGPMVEQLAETTVDVIDDISFGSVYLDLDSPNLLTAKLTSTNDDATEKIEGVANGLLFMGVLPLKNLIKMIPFTSKDDSKPLLKLVDQLKAVKGDGEVVLEINKPEDFDNTAVAVYYPLLKDWSRIYEIRTNLQLVSRAALNYSYSNDGNMPFLKPEGADWNEELSWRVRILPHYYTPEFRDIQKLADLSQSWEHENNQQLIEKMPSALGPEGGRSNIVWVKTKVQQRDDVTDDNWSTVMLVRLPDASDVPWIHPDDEISVIKLLKLISNLEDGEKVYAATYSCNVIAMDNTWKPQKIKAYLTPSAGDEE